MNLQIISHNDLDGVGCVILTKLANKLNNQIEKVKYKLCTYGEYNNIDQYVLSQIETIGTDRLLISDICPSQHICASLDTKYIPGQNTLKLFDHHKTSSWVAEYPWAVHNKKICGTDLVYEYFKDTFVGSPMHKSIENFVSAVSAWDLWKLKNKNRRRGEQLNTLLKLLGLDEFIQEFYRDINSDKTMFARLISISDRRKDKFVKRIIRDQLHSPDVYIDGYNQRFKILVVSEYISEVAHAALTHLEYGDLDYVVCVNPLTDTVSLRSRGNADVEHIAKHFHGGGHPQASGFPLSMKEGLISRVDNMLNKMNY